MRAEGSDNQPKPGVRSNTKSKDKLRGSDKEKEMGERWVGGGKDRNINVIFFKVNEDEMASFPLPWRS